MTDTTTGKPIPCPACGGVGTTPTDAEGDRPAITCDMCGGAGWGLLDSEGCPGGCHEHYHFGDVPCACPCHKVDA